jgi:sterol desaturase/sphingolipid hydroxylase (fatty acid hydroxylase superfamily)
MLSLVWVTPNVHKIHHSRKVMETNSNYANLITLYDRLLGTYTPVDRVNSLVYGLDDADPGKVGSFPALLVMPFEPAGPEARTAVMSTEGRSRIEI